MLLLTLIAVFDLHDAVLCAVQNTTASVIPVTTTEKIEFVQKLKENLRRNNDDYILGRNLTETETPKESSEHSSAYIDDIEEVYRRALVERGTHQLRIRNQYNIGQAKRPVPSYSANNMIQETNNKMAGAKASGVNDAKGDIYNFRAMDLSKEKPFIPRPDQLDMAPAKGRQIHQLRKKRHVLIPEGPKYDSRGKVYLRAHPAHAARPYARTRAPRLLLPRCCNCCKKSALGCE